MIKRFKLMMVHHSVYLLMKQLYSFEHRYNTITCGISFWRKKKKKAGRRFIQEAMRRKGRSTEALEIH